MQKPYNPQDDYDDDNIPEIDLPQKTDMIPELPDDSPRRDGPSGELNGKNRLRKRSLFFCFYIFSQNR